MTRARQHRHFDRAITFFARDLDLLHGSVLIVLTLHDQDWHADVSESLGDVPLAEIRIEPGAVPTLERAIDVGMPARQPCAQVAGFISPSGVFDCGNAFVFDE